MDHSLDYYEAAPNSIDCAKWLTFIRFYCFVRTPACIYSKLQTPSSMRIFRTTHAVAAPEFICNMLVELNNAISVREAEIQSVSGSINCNVMDLLVEHGVLPFRERQVSSTFKPWGVEPYRLSQMTVVRLGEELVATCVAAGLGTTEQIRADLVRCATLIGRSPIEPGPLWEDEIKWLVKHGGRWLWGVVDTRHGSMSDGQHSTDKSV